MQQLLFCDIWKSYVTAEENKKNWFVDQILCKMSLTFKKSFENVIQKQSSDTLEGLSPLPFLLLFWLYP